MKNITIYTDGSCKQNPGPGGWCAILVYRDNEKVISGGDTDTTNNRMELTAVIEALKILKEPCGIKLVSDSKYVIDAITKGWAVGWRSRGWKKADKSDALNPDLWSSLLDLLSEHELVCEWTRGHAGHEYNERCDKIAQAEAEKYR